MKALSDAVDRMNEKTATMPQETKAETQPKMPTEPVKAPEVPKEKPPTPPVGTKVVENGMEIEIAKTRAGTTFATIRPSEREDEVKPELAPVSTEVTAEPAQIPEDEPLIPRWQQVVPTEKNNAELTPEPVQPPEVKPEPPQETVQPEEVKTPPKTTPPVGKPKPNTGTTPGKNQSPRQNPTTASIEKRMRELRAKK